jgi:plasmid stabilization system protein ParE
MRIVILKAAQAEFDDATDYYAEHASLRIAEAFVNDFQHVCQRLAKRPEIGTSLSMRLRFLPLRHFPYSVIYRLSADAITIQAIAHQRRQPKYWNGRR